MNSTCLHFLRRRYKPTRHFLGNPPRSDQFQYSFVHRSPAHRSQLKNFQANLLVPYKIKSPSILQELIWLFPIVFCAKRQGPYKHISINAPKENSSQRQCRHPYWNHVAPNSLCSSRAIYNTICPEITSPTNESITEQVSPENSSGSLYAQRNPHGQRNTRSPELRLTSIVRCVENSDQYTKAISASQASYSHKNKVPKGCSASRSCPRQLQNSIFTIVSSQERPSQQAQTSLKQCSPSQRQSRMCSATRSASHILYVSTSVNDNSSPQELQCFKTSVSHQVVHGLSIMAKRQSYNHVP